jgi:fatty acid desaturase
MRLRNAADVRTLIWTFLLMPGVVVAQYTAPALAPWLTPLSFYLAYCAAVITHNHGHCPMFVARPANRLVSAWLSLFYGYPTFAWIPTHNRNHHRYVNRPGDATITWRNGRANSALAASTFFFVSSVAQRPLIAAFLRDARRRRPGAFAGYVAEYALVFGGHAAACAVAVARHGPRRGLFVYVAALGGPALAALWGVMFTNYVQHVDCDPWSRWNHSRNFVSGWMNALVFDNGFHTIHHERPGLHWSRLRAEHRKIAGLVDPRLNEGSIFGYCLKVYGLARLFRRFAPVPLGVYASPPARSA